MSSFIEELQRRRVVRVALAYLVVAWLILQLTDLVFENINAPDWVMQAIMLALAIGLPIALILAWAFQMTPDGVHRDNSDFSQTGESNRNSRLFYAFVALTAAVGVGLYMVQGPSDSESGTDVEAINESLLAIAVLPFESFTEGKEDQYFADGLADTLLHKLAQLETLTVIARNSSFQFKGQNVDVREIGAKLGVPTILEGSVQRQGNQIRVIAQLVGTKDGAHWWSGTFDGTFDNVFALQDEIAAAITEQLQITLSDRDRDRMLRNGTANPAAYETLMRAHAFEIDYDDASYDVDSDPKLALLQEVVSIDPDYALGWVSLSSYYSEIAFRGVDDNRYDEFSAESEEHALKAIEVDPNEEASYVVLGFANWRQSKDVASEASFRKALSINPNSDGALSGLGLVLVQRDPEEAYRLFSRAQQIDPRSMVVYRQLYFALSGMGRRAEGTEKLREGIAQHPDSSILYADLASSYADSFGRYGEAARITSDLLSRTPNHRTSLFAMADHWYAVNDLPRANAWLNDLLEKYPDDSGGQKLKVLLLHLDGDDDTAMTVATALPSDGYSVFTRELSVIMLCMTKQDSICVGESVGKMNVFYSALESQRAQVPRAWRHYLNLISGWLNLPDAKTSTSALEDTERGLSDLGILYDGGRAFTRRGYQRAAALILLDRIDEAMIELNQTLSIADGGFVEADMFGLPPERSLLLEPLRDEPGYDEWLAEFTARRTAMRESMIEMEAAGEIARAP
jgi:TolB-like protein/Tfp pilus assembly protein PilF